MGGHCGGKTKFGRMRGTEKGQEYRKLLPKKKVFSPRRGNWLKVELVEGGVTSDSKVP